MSKREPPGSADRGDTKMDLSHLRRETRTALELAVVALAPSKPIDRLASSTGLLEALDELPAQSAPVVALVPKLVERSRAALKEWDEWQKQHLAKGSA